MADALDRLNRFSFFKSTLAKDTQIILFSSNYIELVHIDNVFLCF